MLLTNQSFKKMSKLYKTVWGFAGLACLTLTLSARPARADSESRDWAASGAASSMISVGLIGGVNFSRLNVSAGGYNLYSGTGVGFDLGVTSDVRVFESFFFTPEIIYSSKNIIGRLADLNFRTLSIPLLLKFKTDQVNEHFITSVFAGPTLDMLMGSTIADVLPGFEGQGFQLGMDIGVGVDLMVQPEFSLGLDMRYHIPFGDAFHMVSDANDEGMSFGSRVPSLKLLLTAKYYF